MKTPDNITDRWSNCSRCDLCKYRSNIVLGSGDIEADIMFIGQNPGPREDKNGIVWSGVAGKYFEASLNVFGLNLETTFNDNTVACASFILDEKRDGYLKLGKPSKQQLDACRERLHETIYTVDPIIIVALGQIAHQTLTGEAGKMDEIRERPHFIKVPGVKKIVTYPMFVTYNPASLCDREGNPVDSNGNVFKPGKHKSPGTPQDKFMNDLSHIISIVDNLHVLNEVKR